MIIREVNVYFRVGAAINSPGCYGMRGQRLVGDLHDGDDGAPGGEGAARFLRFFRGAGKFSPPPVVFAIEIETYCFLRIC